MKHCKMMILACCLASSIISTSLFAQFIANAPLPSEISVFQNGDDGYLCYRIPAIVKAPDGNLLAFCEARRLSCSDHGDVRIVLKRSTDNGQTWSKLAIVAEYGNNQAGNPAPVFDMSDKRYPQGRLFLFYNTGTGSEAEVRNGKAMREVWYKTSLDGGQTWSTPVNITRFVSKPNFPQINPAYNFKEDWRHYANTPGHALQLSKGIYRGRIFIAANHSEGAALAQGKDYFAHGFYTDDHGKTWKITPNVTYAGSNESTAAESSNGGILLNCRNQSGDAKYRIMATSTSAGAKWDSIYVEQQLADPVCEGSMLNYTSKTGQKWLLFANLDHQNKRENLTLKVSADEGKTWRLGKVICATSSAYADLVIQQDQNIGILYEKDNYSKIVYAQVKPESLFQTVSSTHTDLWKGFERKHLQVGQHRAYYVQPKQALPGNPWVWRASFPDWHTEMDSLLLAKGFHLVFVHVDDQYGSPAAMQAWDQVYNHLVDSMKFAPKVALEGVSRGGLYVYAWAKRNPDKVSCIYNEAPVCDIKSWPGGKGKGQGDPKSWTQFQEVFKFNEAEALAFKDNPIDNLEGLASFKVPILHVISNQDKIVPSDENTYLLSQKYTALGGPATIYPVTDGPQTLEGHHFPINKAAEWADFIYKHSFPVKKPLPNRDFIQVHNGLKNIHRVILTQKKATVAFLGGSITYNKGWRDKTCAYLKERFPHTEFTFIAAGIPSLGSLPHSFRLQRDVLDKGKVDLLFVEAAVNDRANGTDSLTQVRALEGIVRHARMSNPQMDIVLMAFADPDKTQDFAFERTPVEVHNHELIASHYQLPFINLARAVADKMGNQEFSWAYDFKDLHPSPFGQELYFSAIKTLLTDCFNDPGVWTETTFYPSPLNRASFDKGKYYPIENAKRDKHWTIDPDWTSSDGLPTREGFVHLPMLVANTPGSAFSLSFRGTAVGISLVAGGDAGMITYSIDGGPSKTLDLYTQWSSQLHLPWYLILGVDLKPGAHTLNLKISAEKNPKSSGNACRIVHFLLNE